MKRQWGFVFLCIVSFFGWFEASYAEMVSMPTLKGTYAAPGAASQMEFSKQHNLLFMRNSGSAIRVFDVSTGSQIGVRLANQNFTDIDLTPDGQYLYAADWGQVSIGYGTLVNPHYVQRFNLATRQWEVKQSTVDTFRLEAVDADRVLLLESDQWVDISLASWGNAAGMTNLSRTSADYYGDIEFDPVTGRIYHGNSGSSSREISAMRLNGNAFGSYSSSGTYGSAQNGGGTSTLSLDGERFYYGALQVEALDITNSIRTFPSPIYAATADLAFGQNGVYDAKTGATLGSLGYTSTVFALDEAGQELWTYANNTLYNYSLVSSVPEPNGLLLVVIGSISLLNHRRRTSK